MIRLATVEDAEQLYTLNRRFNGDDVAPVEMVRASLGNNMHELTFVADEDGILAGFLCVQLKHSFCYRDIPVELTELYVSREFRRRGLARELITFAQNWCAEHYQIDKFTLLTGQENTDAQQLYQKLGFFPSGEMHLEKNND